MTTTDPQDKLNPTWFYALLALLFARPLISGTGIDYLGARTFFDSIIRIGFILVVVFSIVGSQKKRIILPAPYGVAIWLGAALLSVVLTRLGGRSWFVSLQRVDVYVSLVAVSIAVATYADTDGRRRKVVEALLAGCLVAAIYGIWQYFFGFDITSQYIVEHGADNLISADDALKVLGWKRIFSTTFSPDMFAGMTSAAAPLSLAYFIKSKIEKKKRELIFGALTFFSCVTALYLTGSLGGWLASGVGFAALSLFIIKSKRNKAIVAVFLAVVFIAASIGIMSRRQNIFANLKHVNNPITQRYYYWENGGLLFARRPLFGVGPAQFGNAYLEIKPQEAGPTRYAHNFIVQYAAELGTPGAVGFLLIVICFLTGSGRLARKDVLNAGVFASGCAFLAHSLIDYDTEIIEVAYIFWAVLGLAAYEDCPKESGRNKAVERLVLVVSSATIALSLWSLIGARLMQNAKYYMDDGNVEGAVASLEKARYFRFADPAEAKLEAQIFSAIKGYDLKAITAWKRLIKVDYHDPFSFLEFGNYYLYRGNYAEAEKMFISASSLYPTYPTAKASAYFCRAHILLKQGDLDGAKIELQKVLKEFPNHKGAIDGLSLISELEKSETNNKLLEIKDYQ